MLSLLNVHACSIHVLYSFGAIFVCYIININFRFSLHCQRFVSFHFLHVSVVLLISPDHFD